MTNGISAWGIRHPIPVIVLFFALTVTGWLAFMRLPINANPSISFPIVNVTVSQSEAAPAELESQVTRQVEGAIAALPDVRHVYSTISRGLSETTVEFALDTDPDRATNDVRNAISQIRSDLPGTIDEPIVTPLDIEGGAILYYVVKAADMAPLALSWFVEDRIKSDLLTVPGVQRVQRLGGLDREIRVELDPNMLLALGISAADVNEQLLQMNTNTSGGRSIFASREQTIRVLGSADSTEALGQRQISLPSGGWARLSDLATISDGAAEFRDLARYDGERVVGFAVSRSKGASDTTVAEAVAAKLDEIQNQTAGIEIVEVVSTVEYTHESYQAAIDALLEGAFLTIVVVFLFLRSWRATFIAAVAIPLSILPTFAVMSLLDFTLNSLTLLALILVIGVLVDDVIVEVENIDRHIQMGKRPYAAAIEGADSIGLAVVSTTLTIVAIFAPVSFVGGAVGQYFRQFGLTVVVAVLFSLLVARLLTPLMAAYILRPQRGGEERHGTSRPSWLHRFYLRLLSWALHHRAVTVALGMAVLVGSVMLVPLLPTGFLPVSDSNVSQLKVELTPGSRIEDTDRTTNELARQLVELPAVEHVLVLIEDVNEATMVIGLTPRDERDQTRIEIEETMQQIIENIPDIRFAFLNDEGGRDVSITLGSRDPALLAEVGRQVVIELGALPEIGNVKFGEPLPQPELQIEPRFAEAARLGVSVAAIGQTARIATAGDINANSARFSTEDRQIPIHVMLSAEALDDPKVIGQLRVRNTSGTMIPLSSVAALEFGNGAAEIERHNHERSVVIEADLNGVPLGTALAAINAQPTLASLPDGVRIIPYGDAEYMDEMFVNFAITMGIGLMLMFAILILLFRDFLQPITIFVALPLSIGGAILSLLLYGAALDLSSIIGFLMLMGIVSKNSILLVDSALASMREGLSCNEALMKAGAVRARPIIMTTLAMIAGMTPAALGIGADADFRAPMAVAVMGGLATSTLLSLIFVPVVFSYMHRMRVWLKPRVARLTSVTDADLKGA